MFFSVLTTGAFSYIAFDDCGWTSKEDDNIVAAKIFLTTFLLILKYINVENALKTFLF